MKYKIKILIRNRFNLPDIVNLFPSVKFNTSRMTSGGYRELWAIVNDNKSVAMYNKIDTTRVLDGECYATMSDNMFILFMLWNIGIINNISTPFKTNQIRQISLSPNRERSSEEEIVKYFSFSREYVRYGIDNYNESASLAKTGNNPDDCVVIFGTEPVKRTPNKELFNSITLGVINGPHISYYTINQNSRKNALIIENLLGDSISGFLKSWNKSEEKKVSDRLKPFVLGLISDKNLKVNPGVRIHQISKLNPISISSEITYSQPLQNKGPKNIVSATIINEDGEIVRINPITFVTTTEMVEDESILHAVLDNASSVVTCSASPRLSEGPTMEQRESKDYKPSIWIRDLIEIGDYKNAQIVI